MNNVPFNNVNTCHTIISTDHKRQITHVKQFHHCNTYRHTTHACAQLVQNVPHRQPARVIQVWVVTAMPPLVRRALLAVQVPRLQPVRAVLLLQLVTLDVITYHNMITPALPYPMISPWSCCKNLRVLQFMVIFLCIRLLISLPNTYCSKYVLLHYVFTVALFKIVCHACWYQYSCTVSICPQMQISIYIFVINLIFIQIMRTPYSCAPPIWSVIV